MKHDYTGRFAVGQMVYLNDKSSTVHGKQGTVTEINLNGRGYPYRVKFNSSTHVYHPEHELSADPIMPTPRAEPLKISSPFVSMDISSGFGIGGVGSDDHNMSIEPAGVSYVRQGCKWGGTRYDEACAGCGRVTAICNDCELCENCHG